MSAAMQTVGIFALLVSAFFGYLCVRRSGNWNHVGHWFGWFSVLTMACLALPNRSGNRQSLIVDREQSTVQPWTFALSTVSYRPSTVYGSTIKDTYHNPGCRYLGYVEHPTEWSTEEEAEQDGKVPCKHCH